MGKKKKGISDVLSRDFSNRIIFHALQVSEISWLYQITGYLVEGNIKHSILFTGHQLNTIKLFIAILAIHL